MATRLSNRPTRGGLRTVLLHWPAIRAGVPNAELAVYYGFSSMSNVTEKEEPLGGAPNRTTWSKTCTTESENGNQWEELLRLLEQPGVRYVGMVGHHELSKAFAEARGMSHGME